MDKHWRLYVLYEKLKYELKDFFRYDKDSNKSFSEEENEIGSVWVNPAGYCECSSFKNKENEVDSLVFSND